MAIPVYKKIKQSEKRKKRSIDLTTEEQNQVIALNNKFLELFRAKHL